MTKNVLSIKDHRINIKQIEKESKVQYKLQKLFDLNKTDINKVNDNLIKMVSDHDLIYSAYEKLKRNPGVMTPGTNEETADEFDISKVKELSEKIRNGKYEWTDIRRKEIQKVGKKGTRPLGIPNFKDKIVQECIRIVLNAIFEPVFQHYEFNHGFRPNRSPKTALIKLQEESKEMDWALEGDIVGAYNFVDHDILMNSLKEKIRDKKFLRLISTGLKQNIVFEGNVKLNLIGVPQGGIASPILFNIYMHKFDIMVDKLLKEKAQELNFNENRTVTGKISRFRRRITSRIEKANKKMNLLLSTRNQKRNKMSLIKYSAYIELRNKNRLHKKKLLQMEGKRKDSLKIRFSYSRYADDWIIITNGPEKVMEELKEIISKWIREHSKMEMDQEKTKITNLHKDKALYLGYSIFKKKKRVIRKTTAKGKTFRQRSTVPLTIGIDHERLKYRLQTTKVIDKKYRPTSVPVYAQLKPWEIVTKFRQRIEGVVEYYYEVITFPSELNYYHYAYKFSCLKTIARRQKTSISQVTKKYGKQIKIKYETEYTTRKGEKKVQETVITYPTYSSVMNTAGKRAAKNEKIRLYNNRKGLRMAEIKLKDVYTYRSYVNDPFSMHQLVVNLKTGYKIHKHCCICGTTGKRNNPIQMHHVKHVRKGKVSGFTQIMKQLNRKTIPTCLQCHKKIHKGTYDGYALSSLYDKDLIQA